MRALLCAVCLAGCVSVPDEGQIQIQVTPRDPNPTADGYGQADLRITLDEASELFRREVQIEVATGAIGGPDDPRRLRLRTPADGVIELPWRYGTTPGRATVQVSAADYTVVDDSLLLAPQTPERITLTADQTTLEGDGRSQTPLELQLGMDDPSRSPSDGTVVHLVACCSVTGVPIRCAAAPFSVPSELTFRPDDRPQITVTAARLPATMDEERAPVEGVVLAAAGARPECEPADSAAVGSLRIEVLPPQGF